MASLPPYIDVANFVREVVKIEDPALRLRAIRARMDDLDAAAVELRILRQAAVIDMRERGASWDAIGAELGVTGARAQQLST